MIKGTLSQFKEMTGAHGVHVEITNVEEERIILLPQDERFNFSVTMDSSQNTSEDGFHVSGPFDNFLSSTGLRIHDVTVLAPKIWYKKGEVIECEGVMRSH